MEIGQDYGVIHLAFDTGRGEPDMKELGDDARSNPQAEPFAADQIGRASGRERV